MEADLIFLHILRVTPKGIPFLNGVRCTLYVTMRDGRIIVFLDYPNPKTGRVVRAEMSFDRHAFFDAKGVEAELPSTERDLGDAVEIRFASGGDRLGTSPHSYTVYSRLPTPPAGATLVTATASVQMTPRVRAT